MDESLQMIEDCEARESRLNDWEAGFIDSIRHRLHEGLTLTPKQVEKLENVWGRATANG